MKTIAVIRIIKKNATELLASTHYRTINDTVIEIECEYESEFVSSLLKRDKELIREGNILISSIWLKRVYEDMEMQSAKYFTLTSRKILKKCLEEFGLNFSLRQVPSNEFGDEAPVLRLLRPLGEHGLNVSTFIGEELWHADLLKQLNDAGLIGVAGKQIIVSSQLSSYQYMVTEATCDLSKQVRFVDSPRDPRLNSCGDGQFVMGNVHISELSIQASSIPKTDLFVTKQRAKCSEGYFRPLPFLIATRACIDVLSSLSLLRFFDLEIVSTVD
ncbi:MAG TPA: hypothetical protein VK171_14835 [Fimbriimonas sp.]|nr:hypothetical protein [Fimbriimonas sp.]